jgi:hypothetical protein
MPLPSAAAPSGLLLLCYSPRVQVARDCHPITDICEFLTSDSVEAFVLSYTTLLTSAPGVTPNLLGGLVSARVYTDKNMTKADAREVGGDGVPGRPWRLQGCWRFSKRGACSIDCGRGGPGGAAQVQWLY